MKKLTIILFLLATPAIFMSCNHSKKYVINGWEIEVNNRAGTLSFTRDTLGDIIHDVHLFLNKGNDKKPLSHWSTLEENGTLRISTKNPQTEWTINITGSGIDISAPAPTAFVTGIAPAPEKRIPARVAGQDNDVMYTQMGFVSATNIHNLFDMKTDIMIRFPENSLLTRNEEDSTLMNIRFAPGEGDEISLINHYYDEVVGLAKYEVKGFKPAYKPIAGRFKTAPTGWSSWYCYYMSPTDETLYKETDAIAQKLKPYGLKYIQLDAAYTRGDSANYLEWYKGLFPGGGKAWFKHVIEKGFKPGLWMNIYGANYAKPAMADKYPENFYLKDKEGKLSPVCCSADKTVKRLDYTNPEVFEKHLKPLFETLVNEWGLGYLKAGGWGTWMDFYEKNKETAFNPQMNSREVYRRTLETVRNIFGEDNYLLGCSMHEIGVGFDYFDGSRTGGDDYANWGGKNHWSEGMQTFFHSLFGANYLNGITWWSDPDDVMVRDPLTLDEGRTIVSSISLSGQAYVFSDFVADFSKERLHKFLNSKFNIGWAKNYPDLVKPLPEEKVDLYRKTMPSMPIKAMDLYPYKTEAKCCPKPSSLPKALDLKINACTGQYDVVAMYNWTDADTLKVLDLHNDLGLVTNKDYVAFDFWNTGMIDVLGETIEAVIPRHGTLALIIRPETGHPQLMATSRHITAAKSIRSYRWDDTAKTMSGRSKTIPGDPYILYIYIPGHYKTENIKVDANGTSIAVHQTGQNLIAVEFGPSDKSDLTWSINFAG